MLDNRVGKRQALASDIAKFVFLALFAIVMIVPFIWMISVSFERYANIQPPFPPKLIPEQFSLFNYKLAIENGAIFTAYKNSLIVALGSVALSVSSALLAGYALSKGRFKGKGVIFFIILSTMMIPLETRLIPMYKLIGFMHLSNSYWAIILPNLMNGFGIMLSKQFFDALPDSLGEAAYIDGAGEITTFFKIYLPLTGPISATMCILSFIGSWNQFVWPLVVLTGEESRTIPIFLSSFATGENTRAAGSTMAVASLAIIPIIIVFLFMQKYIVRSVALSGLKGE